MYLGPSGLFVMNADGTNERRITSTLASFEDSPAWSSRGTIAFLAEGAIWTVKASGKGLRRLVPAGGRKTRALAWSPDGKQLAFQHGDGDFEVFVVNEDGTGLENLTNNEKISDESPSWSPDGQAIVFLSNRDNRINQVFAMRAEGSAQTQLTHERSSTCCVSWSPKR